MNENWLVLLIATKIPCKNVEEAFKVYNIGKLKSVQQREISLNMLKMHEDGYSANDIACKYNTHKANVFNRISTAKRSYAALE